MGKKTERRWTGFHWEKSVRRVGLPAIAGLPGRHCHQLRPVLSQKRQAPSLVFRSVFLKEWWWINLCVPGWFSGGYGASPLQASGFRLEASVWISRVALAQATTQTPRAGHTPLQVRSSQPFTPLRSLMKTSPLICENQRGREKKEMRNYNPSTPNTVHFSSHYQKVRI